MSVNHKMLLITTGGTIAGKVATTKKEEDYEIKNADAFSELLKDTILFIKKTQGIELNIETEDLEAVDSSNIKPETWVEIIDIIQKEYDNYDSFVITHGTNTLGYTSAALSFAIANPAKPIIITGSQVPLGMPGSDAQSNLENAIRVAVLKPKRSIIRGVICVFGSHIITGTRVKKDTEFDYDAFKTFQRSSIGRIGRIIDINEVNLDHHCKYHETPNYPVAKSKSKLIIKKGFEPRIVSLTEFPGMDPEILKFLHKNNSIQGFIIRAFGAGDLASSFVPVLEYLKDRDVPVVVTTQAPNGNATLQVNEPGQYLSKNNLVIPAYDMSHESQVTKLSWLLGNLVGLEGSFDNYRALMTEDIRGEISVMWEDEI